MPKDKEGAPKARTSRSSEPRPAPDTISVPPDSRPAEAIAAEANPVELDAGEVELTSSVDMPDGFDKEGNLKTRRIPAGVVKKSELGKSLDGLRREGVVRERESKKK